MDKDNHSGSQPKTSMLKLRPILKHSSMGYRETKTRKKQINKIQKISCQKPLAGFTNFQHTTYVVYLMEGSPEEKTTFGRRHQKHLMKTYLCILKECKLTYKGLALRKSCKHNAVYKTSDVVHMQLNTATLLGLRNHQTSQVSTDSPD